MYHPLRSLEQGNWFKLICGASFQHLPAIRNLTLAYTLAGVDCIDVAADPAVIAAAQDGLEVASNLITSAQMRGYPVHRLPCLMVSLNDGQDPHFRKATFDPAQCPSDCSRPCEAICPAQAIVFDLSNNGIAGVVDSRCYGCGRCLPVCPIQHIDTRSYVSTPAAIAPLIFQGVDAVEIHTQVGRLTDFARLWQAIAPYTEQLKVVAISCGDGEGLIEYLQSIYDLIAPLSCPVIWQTDGRPMSGDIGDGATHAAIKLGQKVLAASLPGYVQLAGGTNRYTVQKLRALGLLKQKGTTEIHAIDPLEPIETQDERSPRFISGVAYGSYARVLLSPVLDQLEQSNVNSLGEDVVLSKHPEAIAQPRSDHAAIPLPTPSVARLEAYPELLWQSVSLANSLVSQLKSPMSHRTAIHL